MNCRDLSEHAYVSHFASSWRSGPLLTTNNASAALQTNVQVAAVAAVEIEIAGDKHVTSQYFGLSIPSAPIAPSIFIIRTWKPRKADHAPKKEWPSLHCTPPHSIEPALFLSFPLSNLQEEVLDLQEDSCRANCAPLRRAFLKFQAKKRPSREPALPIRPVRSTRCSQPLSSPALDSLPCPSWFVEEISAADRKAAQSIDLLCKNYSQIQTLLPVLLRKIRSARGQSSSVRF